MTAPIDQARTFLAAQNPAAALTVLRRALSRRNPYLARANAELRSLAELYVQLTADIPTEAATIGWATYLHRAALHLKAGPHPQTTAVLLIDLAQRRGVASATPTTLITTISRTHGGLRAAQAVAARFSVTRLLHTHGLCHQAERESLAALCQWAPHHDDAPDVTYTHLTDTLALLDQCRQIHQAKAVLHAYGALLPSPETDGYALLHTQVHKRLGNRQDSKLHEDVCARRRHPTPEPAEDLRAKILRILAYGHANNRPSAESKTA